MITKDMLQQHEDNLKEVRAEYEAFNAKRDLLLPAALEDLKNARLQAARASEAHEEALCRAEEDGRWVTFYSNSTLRTSGLSPGHDLSLSGLHRVLKSIGVPVECRVKFMDDKGNQALVKHAARQVFNQRHENDTQLEESNNARNQAKLVVKEARKRVEDLRNELGLHLALMDAERFLRDHTKNLELIKSLATPSNLLEIPDEHKAMCEKALENLVKLATSEVAAANFEREGEKTEP